MSIMLKRLYDINIIKKRRPLSVTASQYINMENYYGAQNYDPLPVVLCKGNDVHVCGQMQSTQKAANVKTATLFNGDDRNWEITEYEQKTPR